MPMPKRTDANQTEIARALRDVGAVFISLTAAPTVGFDALIFFRSRVYVVEIKNGSLSPSARQLTEGERNRKAQVESAGVKYNVIENVQQALELLGLKG